MPKGRGYWEREGPRRSRRGGTGGKFESLAARRQHMFNEAVDREVGYIAIAAIFDLHSYCWFRVQLSCIYIYRLNFQLAN